MNFDFTEDQLQFRDSVARLLEQEWSFGDVRAVAASKPARDLWDSLVNVGLHGALVPESYGGLGLGYADLVLALEELGDTLAPTDTVETMIASWLIARHGSAEQQQAYLPSISRGKLRVSLAQQEPGCGHGEVSVRAQRRSDGSVSLSGAKMLVPYADKADVLLVSALVEGRPSIIICERPSNGFAVSRHNTLDPSLPLWSIAIDGASAPAGAILEARPSEMANGCAFAAAALTTGISAKAFDMALAHVKSRVQFGQPVGQFQAVKHLCADMAVALDGMRTAIYHAAWALDQDDAAGADHAVSIAKAWCGDASRQICNDSLQVHGGMGFTWDYDLHLLLKRAKVLESMHGNATWHRERVAQIILDRRVDAAA